MSENSNAAPLLDLAIPRFVVFRDRGHDFGLYFRRITEADWTAYFGGIRVTSERSGKEVVNIVDATTPRLALVDSVLTGALGYKVSGGAELTSLADWQKKIPLAHRLKAGELLGDARPSVAREFEIAIEGEVVSLDCTWSASVGENRQFMQRYAGLKHILQSPTEEQFRRYQNAASRSIVIGGGRTGKTVYPTASMVLAKLYDELVISVEGYSHNSVPLSGSTRMEIIRSMDMLHKVMAAQEIFQPQSTVEDAELSE